MGQPIIRGIQSVGAVDILYQYNSTDNKLPIPSVMKFAGTNKGSLEIDTSGGIALAGFRLDGEFLRAVQQIASSFTIPILGGGGVSLTNNNRTGTLTINCTKVSTPDPSTNSDEIAQMYTPDNSSMIGVEGGARVYDLTTIAQIQQGQEGGDSVGATLGVKFNFCGLTTIIQFEGCTIATVDPVALTGNDAAGYQVAINYLNWRPNFSNSGNVTFPITA